MKKLLTLVTALTLVFAVAGCSNDDDTTVSDADLVAEATTALLLTDLNEVTDNLTLSSSGLHSSVITWSSSDTSVLANDGSVTRPAPGEDNAVVTLTATITIGDDSDTKEFTVRIIAAVPTLDVTIAVFNTDAVSSGDDIVVTGVIYGFVVGNGIQIWDGTGFVYVYNGGDVDAALLLGDEVAVTGQKTIYYGLPEVNEVSSIEFISTGNALPAYEVTSIVDLFDEDPFDTIYWSKPITVTGMVKVEDDNAVIVATDENNMSYDIVVYYKSDVEKILALKALAGQIVTVDVVVYGYHDGLGAWRVTVASNAVVTNVTPTDAQLAAYEAGQLDLGLIDQVMEDVVLNVVGMTAGSTIAWASDNEAVVSAAGVVTRVAGSDTTVVLTATVTVGAETATRDFTLTVLDANFAVVPITVAEAIASDTDSDPIVVQGIVTAILGSDKIVIQDAVGGPGITTYHSSFNTDNDFAIGDEIILRGTHVIYYGLEELTGLTLVSVVSSGNPVQMSTDITVEQINTDFAAAPYALQGLNAVLTNLVVVDEDYDAKSGYVVVADDSGNEFIFSAYDIPYSDTFVVGDIIPELTVIIWDFYYSASRVIVTEYPGLSDADALIAASAALYVPESVIADIELPLLDEEYPGLSIVWASDSEAVISTTGVVVQPTESGDVTVVLTATITIGEESSTKEFTVIVKELSFGIETIAEIIALANDEIVVTAEFLVSAVIQNGFYITDGTDYILVYTGDAPEGVSSEDYVTVQGERGSYSGTEQIVNPTFTLVTSPVQTITDPGASEDIYTVDQVIAGMADSTMLGQVVQIYGAISLQGDYGNVFFNNPTDGEVEIEVYYKSPSDSITALEAQDGINIITTVYVYSSSRLIFVGAAEDITVVGTVAGIAEAVSATIDDAVVLGNVKVVDVIKNGFYVTDGTSLMLIYTGAYPSDMVVKGSEVLIVGERGEYKDAIQVVNPKVIILSETSAIADLVEPTTITSISDLLAGMADGTLVNSIVRVTTVISIEGSYSNVYINDAADGEIEVEVYYKSPSASIELLEAQDGNTVTINIYVYNNSTVVFAGEASDIE